jgi:hypothetical protein
MEETIYTIDINQCRRNIFLNHKYDNCVFNVMDDIIISHYLEMDGIIIL